MNVKIVKKVICFFLSTVVCISVTVLSTIASPFDPPVNDTQNPLGQSGDSLAATEWDNPSLYSSEESGLLPLSGYSLPKFVDHPNWLEITKDDSTELYNADKPFIVVYYRTDCAFSQSKIGWFREWMNTYDIPIYGVEYDLYGMPTWASEKLPGGGHSNVTLPFMTFVLNKQDIVSYTGTDEKNTVYARAKAVADAMSSNTGTDIEWNGETDLPAGNSLTLNHDIIINGNVTIGSASTVNVPAGITITVNGNLTVDGSLNGIGEVIATSTGTITGSGDFSMAVYTIDISEGIASKSKAKAGATISLTPYANAGHQFEEWQVDKGEISVQNNRFVMPSSTVALHAVFGISPYSLTINAAEGGTTDIQSSNITAGQTVSITALPNAEHLFQRWSISGITVSNADINPLTFIMPSTPVALAPLFESPSAVYYPTTSSSGDSSGGSSSTGVSRKLDTSESTDQLNPISEAEAFAAYDAALKLAKETGNPVVTLQLAGRYSEIDLNVMQGLAARAKKDSVEIRLIIDQTHNSSVVTRLEFNPAHATKTIPLSAFYNNPNAVRTVSLFSKWFANEVVVVSTGQSGEYDTPVKLAVKTTLTNIDVKNLFFYTYDSQSNEYISIKRPAAWLDENGYLHFTTTKAGDIVISSGALIKK